ncbi:MAG: hypothetical protein KAX24_05030, partial [Anaerolineae bacterium]|nr:hypothetical protein [Anaerolineae bacterium]
MITLTMSHCDIVSLPSRLLPQHYSEWGNKRTSFVYAVADNYEALKYFCHDPLGMNISPATVLSNVKWFLAAGIVSMFGFFG